ncbi:MAG: ComF family protein [Alphaproteobacteria bacterium]|nr:ComF family protein [Alphaproteobacteria bacterium]
MLGPSLARAIDFFLPPLCLVCEEPVGQADTICPACWKKLPFIAPPFCARCGMPFDFPVEEETLCGACLLEPPAFETTRTALLYDDESKKVILGFKHGDRTHLAKALAAWMHRAGSDILANADALIPVPLHRSRLFKRRYNQSALLAQNVGKLAQKPALVDALCRIRATPNQGHLKRKERKANVKGAFMVSEKRKALIADKTLVLIDDVMTTGATVDECAKVLLKAGAKTVRVLTLARVKGAA